MAVGRGSAATQGTGLVHDLYMRLAAQTHPDIQNRTHFFAVASRAVRQILVSRARKVSAQRRGGGAAGVTLDEERISGDDRIEELLAVDQALDQLASMNARRAQIIELRYFGGLGAEETAEVLGVSTETIRREARLGEPWLSRLLKLPVSFRKWTLFQLPPCGSSAPVVC